jgi:hypothetical protein
MEHAELVKDTWEELGFEVEARGFQVWVRTLPFPRKIGSIWMPPKMQNFHGELPHLVTIRAVVLSSGPDGPAREFEPGEVVAFKRLHFATYQAAGLKDEQGKVGWVDSNQILWIEREDVRHGEQTTAA